MVVLVFESPSSLVLVTDFVSQPTAPVESTGSVGCETKSVTKTNDDGDTVKKTKTDC